MRKVFTITILFCTFLITGCSNTSVIKSNDINNKTQQPFVFKLIYSNQPEYIKSDDLAYLTEAEVKKHWNNNLSYTDLTDEECENFNATQELINKHILNIVYNATITEGDNFFNKNITSDAEFYIRNLEQYEILATYQSPNIVDESSRSINPGKWEVLLKEKIDNEYIVEVRALNTNYHEEFWHMEEGYIFYVDVIGKKVVYIEKFWHSYGQ